MKVKAIRNIPVMIDKKSQEKWKLDEITTVEATRLIDEKRQIGVIVHSLDKAIH